MMHKTDNVIALTGDAILPLSFISLLSNRLLGRFFIALL